MRRWWPLAAVLLLTACGQAASVTALPATTKPFPGMVSIGDRSVYMECRGRGRPTVVAEAGLGSGHLTWNQVTPLLSGQTRVCSYDRANVGNSDPDHRPRTARDIVADLHAALRAEGEVPPYVLVGFSFGGLTTQLYAADYPSDVAGVVLVDSDHPDEVDQFEAHLTDRQIAADHASMRSNSEGIDVLRSFEQVQAAGSFPDVPLVVVTAGFPAGWPPGWNTALFDRLRAEQQRDLARLSPQGRQIIARESNHNIPEEQPAIVIRAVRIVLRKVQ
jgi:pimeloyl-ACP methyl ester carboxylesterase